MSKASIFKEIIFVEDGEAHGYADVDEIRMMPKQFVIGMMLKQFLTLENETYDIEEQIEKLKRELSSLKLGLDQKLVVNRGDAVYEKLLPTLEEKYYDMIVAIDTENEKVVGVGETIEEAYEHAKSERPEKKQFYFRRVGSSYVERIW